MLLWLSAQSEGVNLIPEANWLACTHRDDTEQSRSWVDWGVASLVDLEQTCWLLLHFHLRDTLPSFHRVKHVHKTLFSSCIAPHSLIGDYSPSLELQCSLHPPSYVSLRMNILLWIEDVSLLCTKSIVIRLNTSYFL